MSGRRSHSRVAFSDSNGMLRVSRDVIVKETSVREFLAVSSQPGIPGDVLTIALAGRNGRAIEFVRVTTSRPVVLNGVVKHELRLERLESSTAGGRKRGQNDRGIDD